MAALSRLFKVGSMSDAMGVYVGAMIVQKAVGLGRLVLLAYLMSRVPQQYGMWGIGLMVAVLAAPVLGLGVGQALRRLVSAYEARGQLAAFYRRVRWFLPVLCIATGCIAAACSGVLTRAVLVSRAQSASIDLPYGEQVLVCLMALANGVVMAMYQGVLGFVAGMRAYRLVSALEVFLGVLFAVLAAGAVLVWPTALALLAAHLVALLVTLACGALALGALVARSAGAGAAAAVSPPSSPGHEARMLGRLVRFGLGAMAATLCLLAARSAGLYLVNAYLGKAPAGTYALFAQLAQPMFMIANAAWAVAGTHAARRWEAGSRDAALGDLQTSYKAVAMGAMTLAVALLALSPLWVGLLPEAFRGGAAMLCGLLLFFQSMTQVSIMHIVARLHERPVAVAASAFVGGALSVVLALRWLPQWGAAGVAWAAGVGMYVGGAATAAAYLLATRTKLEVGTYAILAAPGLFLLASVLPAWTVAAAWAGALAVAIATDWVFSTEEKRRIADALRQARIAIAPRR